VVQPVTRWALDGLSLPLLVLLLSHQVCCTTPTSASDALWLPATHAAAVTGAGVREALPCTTDAGRSFAGPSASFANAARSMESVGLGPPAALLWLVAMSFAAGAPDMHVPPLLRATGGGVVQAPPAGCGGAVWFLLLLDAPVLGCWLPGCGDPSLLLAGGCVGAVLPLLSDALANTASSSDSRSW
jgi:hypothetical protein